MQTTVEQTDKLLPARREEAMQTLIRTTQKLLDLADLEGQSLARSDLIAFASIQDEKGSLARRYMGMAEEFRGRLEEFRGVDSTLLDRLEDLQRKLGEATHQNNKIISGIKNRAQKNTQSTLLTAQELAARHPVTFEMREANENVKAGTR